MDRVGGLMFRNPPFTPLPPATAFHVIIPSNHSTDHIGDGHLVPSRLATCRCGWGSAGRGLRSEGRGGRHAQTPSLTASSRCPSQPANRPIISHKSGICLRICKIKLRLRILQGGWGRAGVAAKEETAGDADLCRWWSYFLARRGPPTDSTDKRRGGQVFAKSRFLD